jgi:hypothetical protein
MLHLGTPTRPAQVLRWIVGDHGDVRDLDLQLVLVAADSPLHRHDLAGFNPVLQLVHVVPNATIDGARLVLKDQREVLLPTLYLTDLALPAEKALEDGVAFLQV